MIRHGWNLPLLCCALLVLGFWVTPLQGDEPPNLWTGRVLPLKYEPLRRDIPVVTALALQPNGPLLAAAGDDHVVRVWNRETGDLVWRLKGHDDWVRSVTFSPDGMFLASGGNDCRVIFWDLMEGTKAFEFPPFPGAVTAVLFNHAGDRLAVTGFESPLLLFNPVTKEQCGSWKCPCVDMRTLAFSQSDQYLAAAGRNGKIRLWKTADGSVVKQYDAHAQRVRGLMFTQDGNGIVSCGEDRTIVVASIGSETIRKLPPTEAKILSVCRIGSWLATGCSDNTIRLWDIDRGREFAVLEGHDGSVAVLESSGELLVSGSYDTTVRSWSVTAQVSAPR